MAYIRCASGGGGAVEVITGTETGTASGTFTATSQQGKAPKRAQAWKVGATGTNAFYAFWNSDDPTKVSMYGSGGTSLRETIPPNRTNYIIVSAVAADSITFRMPTTAQFASGTWGYAVEFE
jgi:hypothetical protein